MTLNGTKILADVYHKYREALVGLAQTFLGCRHAAEDAVHEAFAKLCQNQQWGNDTVAYVFTSVRNAAINQLRRRNSQDRMHESLFNGRHRELETGDLSKGVANREELDFLAAAVDRLEPNEKQLIVLKLYGGLTFDQIGQIMDLPLKTVASRYRRMLERLQIELREKV
jgi:RNA polymerase sigma-70 factor, ECF subfamily